MQQSLFAIRSAFSFSALKNWKLAYNKINLFYCFIQDYEITMSQRGITNTAEVSYLPNF